MKESELLRKWLETLMAGLAAEVDEKTQVQLIKRCGRTCAFYHGDVERARTLRRSARDIDELLDRLNQEEDFWCGRWTREGDTIYSVCEACGCPLVRAGLVELSPTFCNCSRGWVAAVFETILGRPVEVELKRAIGRGDPVCEFAVGLN